MSGILAQLEKTKLHLNQQRFALFIYKCNLLTSLGGYITYAVTLTHTLYIICSGEGRYRVSFYWHDVIAELPSACPDQEKYCIYIDIQRSTVVYMRT